MAPRNVTARRRLSRPFSYIVDWIVILGIAIVGAIFWRKPANRRPFSPVDPSISFPHVLHEKVSTATLGFVSVFVPAVLTAVIALATTPASIPLATTANATPQTKKRRKHTAWRSKLWEWHAAWLGLFLALAVTFLFVEGLKDMMAGGPQVVGGLEGALPLFNALVSWTACRQQDDSILADGFQSFPSGHSAFSWCGMLYLTLYLCAKFSITIPYLLPEYYFHPPPPLCSHSRNSSNTKNNTTHPPPTSSPSLLHLQPRLTAAAPPAYLFPLVLVPVGTATYIASSRFSDFRHHGFDIIIGSLLGMLFAWVGFRMYHLPVQRGRGWSWGARGAGREWGVRVGTGGYGVQILDDVGAYEGSGREAYGGIAAGDEREVEMGLLGSRGVDQAGVVSAPSAGGDGVRSEDIGETGIPEPLSTPPPPLPPQANFRPAVRESRLQRPNEYNSWQEPDGLRSE